MPHQCTNCGKTFSDGSKEMLSGCPECGGNKFQFRPASSLPDSADAVSAGPADADDAGSVASTRSPESEGVPETSDAAARTEEDEAVRTGDDTAARPEAGASAASADPSESDADASTDAPADGDEDTAQASARRDVVDSDELASAVEREARDRPPQDVDGEVLEPQTDDQPGLDELREELNEQFESIKIVSPGQYELNLMELYDRDEYIISLQEDGRYVIEVPDTWRDDAPDES